MTTNTLKTTMAKYNKKPVHVAVESKVSLSTVYRLHVGETIGQKSKIRLNLWAKKLRLKKPKARSQ